MRSESPLLVHVVLASVVFLAAGCGQPSPAPLPAASPPVGRATSTISLATGLNPVALGGLADTVRIDVLAFVSSPEPGSQPGYVQRLAVTEPGTVRQVLAALNADLKPLPKARCIAEFELHFKLSGGGVQKLGYSCQGASFLRGDQPIWRDQDAQPPAAFDRLMSDLLTAPAPKP